MAIDVPSSLEPARQLALYLASYIDAWDDLMALHRLALAQAAGASDASSLVQIASPLLLAHLQEQEAGTASAQDALAHIIVQRGLETLRAQTTVGHHHGGALLERLATLSKPAQSLIEGHYRHQLHSDALAAYAGVAVKEVAGALCRARAELDWHSQDGVWQAKEGEHALPSLIQEFMSGHLDQASRALLSESLSRDLTCLAGFERQWRLHLLVMAACAQLPFPPAKSDASSHRQKGISSALRISRSGQRNPSNTFHFQTTPATNRYTKTKRSSPTLWYIMGSCFVVVGVSALLLSGSNAGPQSTSTSRTQQAPAPALAPTSAPTSAPTPTSTPAPTPAPARIQPVVADPITTAKPPVVVEDPVVIADTVRPLPAATTFVEPTTVVTAIPPVIAEVPPPPTAPVPPAPVPVVDAPRTIDFLPLIDVARDAVAGDWSKAGKSLRVIGTDKYSILQLPYIAPEEYDLTVTFVRVQHKGDVDCIVTHGRTQCVAAIGAFDDALAGFSMVGGKKVNLNKTQSASPPIINGKRYRMMVSVRKGGMSIHLDDALVSSWDPTKGALAMNPQWAIRNKEALGIGIYIGALEFQAISVREVSGRGRLLGDK